MPSLVLASTNRHKVLELKALLADFPHFSLLTLADFPRIPVVEEDGTTLKENAVKKAMAYARLTGSLVMADDSGLCVDALKGAPGVLSARYAGANQSDSANCAKLLEAVTSVPPEARTGRFECYIALATPQKLIGVASGRVEGRIIDRARGENGFGYDPIFLYPNLNQTFAEISREEKNRISHRARALRELKKILGRLGSV